MVNKTRNNIYIAIVAILALIVGVQPGYAQSSGVTVKGTVIESSTGAPLHQVIVSVTSTGNVADTDKEGNFSITVPNLDSELDFYSPGYVRRQLFLNGKDELKITLVPEGLKSMDNSFSKPFGKATLKEETYAVNTITAKDISLSKHASLDAALQSLAPGLHVVEQSGLPGGKSFLNIRGFNTLVGRSEPLLIVDGMIHAHNYANYGSIEGFTLNPFDLVDIDDVADITILKGGDAHLGGAGSNGVIYLNTQQESSASTLIKISGYAGISFTPKKLDVLNGDQYKNYLTSYMASQGISQGDMEKAYPWLKGEGDEKYKYDNNTDWQKELFNPGVLQKYHLFLKGGDDIATYNISAGWLNQQGTISDMGYNRFNLRVNGKINITNKFSLSPNIKLSLADENTANFGPTVEWNPLTAAILKPSIMAPNARDKQTGETLPYLDDDGAFGVSNPSALAQNAIGQNRNYHFMSSVNAEYKFNEHFKITNLLGINFNNARENIFIPGTGVVAIDSAENTPREFVYEFRSTQNHMTLHYNNVTDDGRKLDAQAGFRYMANSYKHNLVTDLNTPSDDFKNLGHGSRYNYLREALGDNRGLVWMSYFANGNYSIRNKYFINANVSVDANSALNKKNRYNVFPSIGGAWRISSEEFMADNTNIEDLKLRGSVSMTGNMYSSVYDYSKLYYTESRINTIGVLSREAIPNEDLGMEKTTTLNLGVDFSGKQQRTNIHADLYYGLTHNMIIEQELPPAFGYTSYFDNGGSLSNIGLEIAADHHKMIGDNMILTLGGTATTYATIINSLDFIDDDQNNIITSVMGAEYITKQGGAINAFYGYETDGIFQSDDEAKQFVGPKGEIMQAGDVRFVDVNGDKVINYEDKTTIGNPNPVLFGGLFGSLNWDRWQVRAMFNYSVGNSVFNYVRYKAESMDTYANQFSSVEDRWSSDNTAGTLPRASYGDLTGNSVFSDRWMEDGSYLKLKSLTVSYTLPESGLYSGVQFYCTMSNLFTLSGYSGYDPEFYYMNNPFYMGVDYGKMPQSRSFIIGVKLDL